MEKKYLLSSILIAIIFATIVFLGKDFLLRFHKSPEGEELETNDSSLKNKSTLAVVIDSETYNSLKTEISQYEKDVENDSNYKVVIKDFPINENIELIKSYLKNLYLKDNLRIVVLIGEVPTAMYFPGSVSSTAIPTDSYYYDIYDKCPYNKQNEAFEARDKFCDPITIPFVVSRITPPVKGQEGIRLLKNYFNNNHAFRTGEIKFNQMALIYAPLLNDLPEPKYALESMRENMQTLLAIKTLKIYNDNELFFAEWKNTSENLEPNTQFLTELSGNYQYVHVEAHGDPTFHDFDIDKNSLKKPNAFYTEFTSCNVGKFTTKDYIAGYYLLKGKSMFVNASSDYFFGPVGSVNSIKLFLLKQGQPISKIIEDSVFPSYIIQNFGDPTLKMPQGELQKNSTAKIQFKTNNINFGQIKVCKKIEDSECKDLSAIKTMEFNFSNTGAENLGFFIQSKPDYSLDTIKNSHPLPGYLEPYRINFNIGQGGKGIGINDSVGQGTKVTNETNVIKPNETKNVKISLWGIAMGNYTGKILIYSNDPQKPIIEIPFNVEVIE